MLKSLASAFLMYSRIPMPKVEWKEENRRYALCFFPLIGVVIGILFCAWSQVCSVLGFNDIIRGAVAMFIPFAVTGGIHMDGYCDVNDARASWGDRDKKLSIMKDSHIGAFASIHMAVYLILQTAVFSQISGLKMILCCGLCFVLSRALSGIAAVTFRSANKEGTLQSFVRPSHRTLTLVSLCITALIVYLAVFILSPVSGVAVLIVSVVVFLYYRRTAYKEFGGTTGDIAGWFLQLEELLLPFAVIIAERVREVLV